MLMHLVEKHIVELGVLLNRVIQQHTFYLPNTASTRHTFTSWPLEAWMDGWIDG